MTVPHRTTSWEYFITKQNWDPNAALARISFDLQPFFSRTQMGANAFI
ncbi:lytic polysaccharide monooxygenase [Arsenophonus endosymbiont of Bemisia tabaci]|nr:lytic polysaccharide monooxygenase [Arsenophonus endosymbiont of Bemisia tabaci]